VQTFQTGEGEAAPENPCYDWLFNVWQFARISEKVGGQGCAALVKNTEGPAILGPIVITN